jgi:hypothetical protein
MKRSNLWRNANGSKRKSKKSIGSDIKVLNPDGTLREIIPVHKSPNPTFSFNNNVIKTKDRTSSKYEAWRSAVMKRDGRTCVLCGSTDYPNAHHITRWADDYSLRFDVKNGVVVCLACHSRYHGKHMDKFPEHITSRLIHYIERIYGEEKRNVQGM